MRGDKIGIEFGKAGNVAGDRGASPPGGAARAFAGLFAATASLTGAAMTARTVCRAGAGPGLPKGRRRIGMPGCALPIRLRRSTQSPPEALARENGGAVTPVPPQPVGDQAMAAE